VGFLSHVADLGAMGFFNPMSSVNNVVGLKIPCKRISRVLKSSDFIKICFNHQRKMVFENLKKTDIVEEDMAFYDCATVTTLVRVFFFPEHILGAVFLVKTSDRF